MLHYKMKNVGAGITTSVSMWKRIVLRAEDAFNFVQDVAVTCITTGNRKQCSVPASLKLKIVYLQDLKNSPFGELLETAVQATRLRNPETFLEHFKEDDLGCNGESVISILTCFCSS